MSATGSAIPRTAEVPVRARLALSFAIVTLVLVALGGLLFARSFRSGLEDSLEPGLRTQAAALAQQVRERGAGAALDDAQAGPTQGRDVVEQILDRSGHVLASTREAGDRPVVGTATVRAATGARTFVSVSVGGEREPYRVLAAPVETASGRRW